MFETTNTVLDDNNSLWSGSAAFVDATTRAKSNVNAIRIKQGQELPTGDTTAKWNARDDAEQKGLAIGGMVAALAARAMTLIFEQRSISIGQNSTRWRSAI